MLHYLTLSFSKTYSKQELDLLLPSILHQYNMNGREVPCSKGAGQVD